MRNWAHILKTFKQYRGEPIPAYMHDSIVAYLQEGRPVGNFLQAVISNDLYRACMFADDHNIRAIPEYAAFFYNYAPMASWGSPENYNKWISIGGMKGHQHELRIVKNDGTT